MNTPDEITIRELYPDLSAEELREAEYNLERYLEVMLRIYQRLELDPEANARFKALASSEPTITRDH